MAQPLACTSRSDPEKLTDLLNAAWLCPGRSGSRTCLLVPSPIRSFYSHACMRAPEPCRLLYFKKCHLVGHQTTQCTPFFPSFWVCPVTLAETLVCTTTLPSGLSQKKGIMMSNGSGSRGARACSTGAAEMCWLPSRPGLAAPEYPRFSCLCLAHQRSKYVSCDQRSVFWCEGVPLL